jgi:membrane-bound lytic murein transglycosylase B
MAARIPRSIIAFAIAITWAIGPVGLTAQDAGSPSTPVPFSDWLAQLRKDAIAKGISERTVEAALSNLEPLPVVVERDRTQAERTLSVDQYLKRRLDRKTVKKAREMAKRHAGVLARVSAHYGVPPGIIVAVWGLESNFGRFSGVRPTIASLATLAYDNRRAAMFREELFSALRILDRGDIDLSKMKGSWAGAMGQPQFMPSSYLKYAEDFDGDGRRDIWGSEADVFASVANYLKQSGWTTGTGWGRAVTLPKPAMPKVESAAPLRTAGCEATRQMTEGLSWSRWRALGVRPVGRQPFPKSDGTVSLVRAGTRNFLVLDNYAVLLQYNCAHAYALAVALLADQIPPARTPRK